MRVVYLGKDKPAVIDGLRFLVKNGVQVTAVVGPREEDSPGALGQVASTLGISVLTDDDLYVEIQRGNLEIDLAISFLFWKRIRRPLIETPRLGCINLHPAPLPDFRGVGGYNVAILENLKTWGVSAHFVDETFDTGDLIEVRRFPIDPENETALSLERKSQAVLLDLFRDVIETALRGEPLPRSPQGTGRYVDRAEFERLRRINPDDTLEVIRRKIRAFWFPPHAGASITLHGADLTVVDEDLLAEIGAAYQDEANFDPIARDREIDPPTNAR